MWCCLLIEIRILGHQKVKSGIIFIAVNSITCVFLSFCVLENVLNLEFFCSCFLLVQRVLCTFPAENRFNNGSSVCEQIHCFTVKLTTMRFKGKKTCRDKSCLLRQCWGKHDLHLRSILD